MSSISHITRAATYNEVKEMIFDRIVKTIHSKVKDYNKEYLIILGKEEMIELMWEYKFTAKSIQNFPRYTININGKEYTVISDSTINNLLLITQVL